MLFSAGIGVGIFFYGVSEPLWHQSSNWFAEAGYRSQDEIDMFAINLTIFHWGILGWSPYLVVALCAGLAGFRFNLPFTLRSCFYPLLGEYVWGWIGDIIDGFTIVATVAGVCTSLGLGALQVKAGLQFVGAVPEDLSPEKEQTVHLVAIWVMTMVATASVIWFESWHQSPFFTWFRSRDGPFDGSLGLGEDEFPFESHRSGASTVIGYSVLLNHSLSLSHAEYRITNIFGISNCRKWDTICNGR